LAVSTNVSVAAILSANCREGEMIIEGESLFLPVQPPAATTELPLVINPGIPTPEASTQCTSDFGCPGKTAGMPPLVVDPLSPNLPGFVPCSDRPDPSSREPFVSMGNSSTVTSRAQQGGRIFFVACDFPTGARLAVTIEGPSPDPQLNLNPYTFAQGTYPLAEWPVRCGVQNGDYTITFADTEGNVAVRSLAITPSPIQRILPMPQFIQAGAYTRVVLCNYRNQTNVDIDLYRLTPGRGTEEEMVTSISVAIDATGSGEFILNSTADDVAADYYLRDRSDSLRGTASLWVVP
jgi:hypothetical protein